jgi:hypothetical protein
VTPPHRIEPAPYQELPDSQVLDAATQYEQGFLQLISLPPGTGVLLPALHCGALSLELYLKAWSVVQVDLDDGAGLGVIVRAQTPHRIHRLSELLAVTPQPFRAAFEAACARLPAFGTAGQAGERLTHFDGLFLVSRYPYEPGHDIRGYSIDELRECIAALREATRIAPSSFEW